MYSQLLVKAPTADPRDEQDLTSGRVLVAAEKQRLHEFAFIDSSVSVAVESQEEL